MPVKYIFLLVLSSWLSFFSAQAAINRSSFYSAMMHENLDVIDHELDKLNKNSIGEAFKGALMMKKSGLVKPAKDKLSFFKEGRKNLESALKKDTSNVEYHFLRLIIQENTPKIVNYNSEIKRDASYLRENYKNQTIELQKVIFSYSKKSKTLKPEDFKNELHE
ncbi:hypothetical protein [Aurantibacillus circumpalustris]|uniref:hypothetical protein n=1 Tax=Aurantibacillus circumpalustris TaxID=3036359 RepID=UPI00295C0C6F|nr:hypothetical protein [Aurantibacillus circumpalustris]